MRVEWTTAEPPLEAVAAAGRGSAAARLEAKVGESTRWTVTRFAEWLVVAGDDLPWFDGVIYLGRLVGAAGVLVPVHRHPLLHPELVGRASASLRGSAPCAALIPDGEGVVVLPLREVS